MGLPNTESNMRVVLMGKSGALIYYKKDLFGVVKASWSHLKEHHLLSHLSEASPVLWTYLI